MDDSIQTILFFPDMCFQNSELSRNHFHLFAGDQAEAHHIPREELTKVLERSDSDDSKVIRRYARNPSRLSPAQLKRLVTVSKYLAIAKIGLRFSEKSVVVDRRELVGLLIMLVSSLSGGRVQTYIGGNPETFRIPALFEYVLVRGSRAICVLYSDDMNIEITAEASLGAEQVAELFALKSVSIVITNYSRWHLWHRKEGKLGSERVFVLPEASQGPVRIHFRLLVEKLHGILCQKPP
jgi:hypothetical protein